ncbi:F-box/LRR-repeat protein [Trifolium pratense]|uniref:F-box/LRR-repeat protein n=1 Tax=Trifolium pratense TaxID=57577 RepID=A0A2K3NNG2_TRIPR|nr:F-box/LRR-repeat protein [Trifolium pratense]
MSGQQSQEDRMSDLPDSLLYHILSFLPTKDAVVTTVLSKRWKPLGLSQIILNFDHKTFPDLSTLSRIFKSFLAKRRTNLPNLPIHSFNFTYHKYSRYRRNTEKKFANIVNIALKRGIQNLILDTKMELPSCILSCKNLVVLKLKSLAFNNVPQVVVLPSLKVLHLERVTFLHYDYFLKLLSGCSILQDLEIKDLIVTTYWGVVGLDKQIETPLWNLVTANIFDDFVPIWFDWFPNVERLHASLVLKEKFPCTFDSISMFHNLTNIELIIHSLNFLFKFKCLIKLLQHCPKLQSLIIDERITASKCHDEDWEEPEIVPKCLLSHLTTCSLRNFIGIPCNVEWLCS